MGRPAIRSDLTGWLSRITWCVPGTSTRWTCTWSPWSIHANRWPA